MSEGFLKRTWIDIDLDQIIENYRSACSMTESKVTCVVKSNAYGHGAVRVSQALQEAGADSFAVACAREGIELRLNSIEGEILVMGLTEPEILPQCMAAGLTLTVASGEEIRQVNAAAEAFGTTADIHIKLDTGFHRLGFACDESAAREISAALGESSHVRAVGLYSHLGLVNKSRDLMQYQNLLRMHMLLYTEGVDIPELHICDSIGLVRYPKMHLGRVRVGAFLFGGRPMHTEDMPFVCEETLAFRSTVSQVRTVAAGEYVGYNDNECLQKDSIVATVCVGYGDGYPRHMSNGKGRVKVRGCWAPVVGIVCMDQMMIDVTDIPGVVPGDVVDLLGGDVRYMEMADMAETNRNECLTILSRRPLRVYHRGGRIVTVLDDMLNQRTDY